MRRAVVVGLLVVLLVPLASVGTAQSNPCVGTIDEPAEGVTVISTQGAKFQNGHANKRPARLVGVGPTGGIQWVYHASRAQGIVWSYDVDPMANGNLFVTATKQKQTLFFELDPTNGSVVWKEQVDLLDTHDADLLDDHRILIANMRNYNPDTGVNNDRLTIYNRTSDEFVWEWRFEGRFPRDGGWNYSDDWTHVNDVDRIAPGQYLASVRNFDQVIVVDRDTGEIVRRLGRDDNHDIMDEQHNPQYLESEGGRPTILIADSGNDRILEYERGPLRWTRTWTLGTGGTLAWPRDADRLPSGNTLVTDSANNRVIEVTPEGEIVWEFYAPWLVYDAERVAYGDEAGGPTISDQGLAGTYELDGDTPLSMSEQATCAAFLKGWSAAMQSTRSPPPTTDDPTTTDPTTDPTATSGQPGFGVVVLVLAFAIVGWRVAQRE